MIQLSITTKRRPHLFKQALTSIEKNLNEFYLMNGFISSITCYDDNSTPEQLDEMRGMFPWMTRWSLAGEGERGHAASLNRMWEDVTGSSDKFCLHWEDDFVLTRKASIILAALDIMAENPDVGQVCFGNPDWTFEGCDWQRTESGVSHIVRPQSVDDYPTFTLNPCLFRVNAFRAVGRFEEVPDPKMRTMEKNYGRRWSDNHFWTADLRPANLRHIGDGQSAYDLA